MNSKRKKMALNLSLSLHLMRFFVVSLIRQRIKTIPILAGRLLAFFIDYYRNPAPIFEVVQRWCLDSVLPINHDFVQFFVYPDEIDIANTRNMFHIDFKNVNQNAIKTVHIKCPAEKRSKLKTFFSKEVCGKLGNVGLIKSRARFDFRPLSIPQCFFCSARKIFGMTLPQIVVTKRFESA